MIFFQKVYQIALRNKKVDKINIKVFNYINKTSKLIRMKESQKSFHWIKPTVLSGLSYETKNIQLFKVDL